MRHVKLQQNLDRYLSCSLPSFSNTNSFLPNSSHFASNPLNPQPVTFMQNSEILSRYLSNYSVEPQRPPASTTVLLQNVLVRALCPGKHLSCWVKIRIVMTLSTIYWFNSAFCNIYLFLFPTQAVSLLFVLYILEKVISEVH